MGERSILKEVNMRELGWRLEADPLASIAVIAPPLFLSSIDQRESLVRSAQGSKGRQNPINGRRIYAW